MIEDLDQFGFFEAGYSLTRLIVIDHDQLTAWRGQQVRLADQPDITSGLVHDDEIILLRAQCLS